MRAPIFLSLRARTIAPWLLLVGVALARIAAAHGSGPVPPLPDASVVGIERGIDLALNCDHAIHELLGEYEACLRSNHEQIGDDRQAETAFRFLAWLRASGAAANGYADGADTRERFRRDFLAAQQRQPVSPARLCLAIAVDCATLVETVPGSRAE